MADGDAWSACAFPGRFRPSQQLALDAVDDLRAAGRRRACVALPPGTGKTAVGLEVARRLGRRTLVLAPTSVVQAQWLAAWAAFGPDRERHPVPASDRRDLRTPLTVLPYSALSAWDGTGGGEPAEPVEAGDDLSATTASRRRAAVHGEPGSDLLTLLHPHGRELVERAAPTGPWTLVLDGCHQLLQAWGGLCRAVADALGEDTWVVGLAATPHGDLPARLGVLHEELFGDAEVGVPLAAAVRDGELAPYQELLYVTTPTDAEQDWLEGERTRFAGLRAELLAATGPLPFPAWLRRRFPGDAARPSWAELEDREPELCRAALRLVPAGLLPLPHGARLREEHRVPAGAGDWARLLAAYATEHLEGSADPDDGRLLAGIRSVLPGLGFTLTARGLRAATSPVDRVCALSASKAAGAAAVLAAEHEALGDDLRAVVLCDVEQRGPATGPPPSRRPGGGEPAAGSARTALHVLALGELGDDLRPVLVTGRTVAMRRVDLPAFRASAAVRAAGLQDRFVTEPLDGVRALVRLDAGPGWTPRRWTSLVTAWLAEGGTTCLVGTRGLLGEGWNCPPVNVVVDLTSASTATAVTQLRGRSLRRDPGRPGKVADSWTVVCVADGHPRGDADHLRAVRKHQGHPAPSPSGELESGIGHCDGELSPYAAPGPTERAGVNARSLARAADRAAARAAWRPGPHSRGTELATVQVRAGRELGLPAGVVDPALVLPRTVLGSPRADPTQLPRRLRPARAWPLPLGGGAMAAGMGLAESVPAGLGAGATTALLLSTAVAGRRYRRQAVALRDAPADARTASLGQLAAAVADALHGCGLTRVGVPALQVRAGAGGWTACTLDADPGDADRFATALDELLAPLSDPRWLVSRLVLPAPASARDRRRLAAAAALGRPVEGAVAWHAVPSELGSSRARVAVFETAWWRHAGPGRLVRSAEPEGQALLALLHGADPFALTTRLRTVWR